MKHLKLFEGFRSSNPVITATGDWSKLTMDGTSIDYVSPNTYIVTYHSNPTPEMVEEASIYGPLSPGDSVFEIVGGDQNGSNLEQRNGMVQFTVDPSYSPEDYKKGLQEFVDRFNDDPEVEEDECLALLEDPDLELTPEFLSHCKAVVSRTGLKIMDPRLRLIFKVV